MRLTSGDKSDRRGSERDGRERTSSERVEERESLFGRKWKKTTKKRKKRKSLAVVGFQPKRRRFARSKRRRLV